MIDHAKLAQLEAENADPDCVVGNPAVHAVDKDALIRLLVYELRSYRSEYWAAIGVDMPPQSETLEAARKAGYS